MSEGAYLNPDLLSAIDRKIGRASITHVGQPLVGVYQKDIFKGDRVRLIIHRHGETYHVDCPFCNDTRGRLAINHRYGLRDYQTGGRGTELWKCYNEECQKDAQYRDDLRSLLLPELDLPGKDRKCRRPEVREGCPTELEPCEFPGQLIPINELPLTHKAVQYLVDRHFDIDEISDVWDVSYAQSVPMRIKESRSQDRIIIPVRQRGVMVGWQARFIGEIDWKATGVSKYMTFFPKSQALYGMDQITTENIIAMFEGGTDVWRYGPGGVCGFGKKLSFDQARLLTEVLNHPNREDPILVLVPDMNDPQSFGSFVESARAVKQAGFRGRFGIAPLPDGTDPAMFARTPLRNLVEAASKIAFTL